MRWRGPERVCVATTSIRAIEAQVRSTLLVRILDRQGVRSGRVQRPTSSVASVRCRDETARNAGGRARAVLSDRPAHSLPRWEVGESVDAEVEVGISDTAIPVGVRVVLEVAVVARSCHPVAADASAGNCQVPVLVHVDRVLEVERRETTETEVEDGAARLQLLGGLGSVVVVVCQWEFDVVGNVFDDIFSDVADERGKVGVGTVFESDRNVLVFPRRDEVFGNVLDDIIFKVGDDRREVGVGRHDVGVGSVLERVTDEFGWAPFLDVILVNRSGRSGQRQVSKGCKERRGSDGVHDGWFGWGKEGPKECTGAKE